MSPFVPREQSSLGGLVEYKYDLSGNLIEQFSQELNRKIVFTWDGLNRLRVSKQIDADVATKSVINATDYFLPGAAGADNWNMVEFAPLDASVFESTTRDPKLKEWATRTRVDSLGNPIFMQAPDPGAGADGVASTSADTPTTLFTYNYDANSLVQSVTTRLSVALNNTSAISMAYADTRINRTVMNSDGMTLLVADRPTNRDQPDSVGNTTTFIDAGFIVRGRESYDQSGFHRATTDGNSNITIYSYETETGLNLLRNVRQNGGEQTWFRYDSAGNTTHVSDKSDPSSVQNISTTETGRQ